MCEGEMYSVHMSCYRYVELYYTNMMYMYMLVVCACVGDHV